MDRHYNEVTAGMLPLFTHIYILTTSNLLGKRLQEIVGERIEQGPRGVQLQLYTEVSIMLPTYLMCHIMINSDRRCQWWCNAGTGQSTT
jgi:hypothetical protein